MSEMTPEKEARVRAIVRLAMQEKRAHEARTKAEQEPARRARLNEIKLNYARRIFELTAAFRARRLGS
jgi:hypothetical protein